MAGFTGLGFIDWAIIVCCLAASLYSRYCVSKASTSNTAEFFLSGQNMPWWLLGISIVGTTFSCDTPNLVTELVRTQGVSGNWVWWAFLLTGMTTVFIYSKLWRRSETLSDLDFYDIRYGGKSAKFLRFFRSIYLGFLLNCLIMATINLAAMKMGVLFFGLTPLESVVYGSVLVIIYWLFGGQRGGIWSDVIHFLFAITGAVYAAIVSIQFVANSNENVSGFADMLSLQSVSSKLNILPDFSDPASVIPYLIIPLAVQWWMVWYSGAEPGGGGYAVQRMLSAKNEKNAIGATLFFNVIHYAVRPWPWIIVALCSIVIFPDLHALRESFPNIPEQFIAHDLGYAAMISQLGVGWVGLIISALLIAYTSTIGTHISWGSSYLIGDAYSHFINPEASEKRHIVYSRITAVIMLIFSSFIALQLKSALQTFYLLLLFGAGTGPVYLLRWFWWRITPLTEIVAMCSSFIIAVTLEFFAGERLMAMLAIPLDYHDVTKLMITAVSTTILWVLFTYLSKPVEKSILRSFYKLTQPGGWGWKRVLKDASAEGLDLAEYKVQTPVALQILNIFIGLVTVYSFLFAIGFFVYSEYAYGFLFTAVSAIGAVIMSKMFDRIRVL